MNNENRDGLTGVWSRKYGLEQLELAVENCAQVALIFADIDRLKPFHDAYGHPPADKLIIEVGREIDAVSGENALVFRLGGDEFGVILSEISLQAAREIAEEIRAGREKTMLTPDGKEVVALTLSIGIAHFPTQVSSAENLLLAADLALMKAKGEGSSRLANGTPYTGRNRVMAIGDFWDDFPEQSAEFLK